MEIVLEIMKIVLPVIFASFGTFLITKYEYGKKIPLDKLEISYNRIYFPIHQMIMEKRPCSEIYAKCDERFKKYCKYVDRSTLIAYRNIDTHLNDEKNEDYLNFENNIINISCMLRRRLGYLEPDIVSVYRYLPKVTKLIIRMLIEIMVVYIVSLVYTFMKQEMVRDFLTKICVVVILIFIFELVTVIWWLLKRATNKCLMMVKRIPQKAKTCFCKCKNVYKNQRAKWKGNDMHN